MKKIMTALALAAFTPLPALAAGDAAAGEDGFKRCRSCHSITAPDGTVIYKGGRTGPNLYGVAGNPAGASDFDYSPSLIAAAGAGLTWNEENFAAFTSDPSGFLKEFTGDSAARSKMTFKLRSGGEDIFAYIQSVSQ